MEKFVYICNELEFVKLIEAFGENLQINENFFYKDDNVFAIQKDEIIIENKDYKYSDKYFFSGKIESIKTFANNIAKKEVLQTTTNDIIYISVHPGGTSEDEITSVIKKVNDQLKTENDQKIFITYHGSQNQKANNIWRKQNLSSDDLIDLNKAIKEFLNTNNDVSKIFNDFEHWLDVLTKLVNDIGSGNVGDKEKIYEEIFLNINIKEESLKILKKQIQACSEQLFLYNKLSEEVKNKLLEIFKENVSKDEVNDKILNSLKELQKKNK